MKSNPTRRGVRFCCSGHLLLRRSGDQRRWRNWGFVFFVFSCLSGGLAIGHGSNSPREGNCRVKMFSDVVGINVGGLEHVALN